MVFFASSMLTLAQLIVSVNSAIHGGLIKPKFLLVYKQTVLKHANNNTR